VFDEYFNYPNWRRHEFKALQEFKAEFGLTYRYIAFTALGGSVAIDRPTGRTTNPRYYAGGDCVNGGREVVDAVADGKRAALAMARQLEGATNG